MGAILKYGFISELDASTGRVRVAFNEDDTNEDDKPLVSGWMPIVVPGTIENKYTYPIVINTHAACLMEDEYCENGIVVGFVYSTKNKPDNDASADKQRVLFSDGSYIEFDIATGNYKVNVKGDVDVTTANGKRIALNGTTNGGVPKVQAIEQNNTLIKNYAEGLRAATQTALVALDALIPGTSAAFITAMGALNHAFVDMENDKVKH